MREDDEAFDSCGGETVAESADATQFKQRNPTNSVDLISEGENVTEEDAEISDRACKGDS